MVEAKDTDNREGWRYQARMGGKKLPVGELSREELRVDKDSSNGAGWSGIRRIERRKMNGEEKYNKHEHKAEVEDYIVCRNEKSREREDEGEGEKKRQKREREADSSLRRWGMPRFPRFCSVFCFSSSSSTSLPG